MRSIILVLLLTVSFVGCAVTPEYYCSGYADEPDRYEECRTEFINREARNSEYGLLGRPGQLQPFANSLQQYGRTSQQNYQQQLQMINQMQSNQQQNRPIHCSPDGFGGFNCN